MSQRNIKGQQNVSLYTGLILAQVVYIPVGRRLVSQLATTLVATKNIPPPFFHPVLHPFLIKNLFRKSRWQCPKTKWPFCILQAVRCCSAPGAARQVFLNKNWECLIDNISISLANQFMRQQLFW